jgi:hypothetical protein
MCTLDFTKSSFYPPDTIDTPVFSDKYASYYSDYPGATNGYINIWHTKPRGVFNMLFLNVFFIKKINEKLFSLPPLFQQDYS